jgi:hypothetical protein
MMVLLKKLALYSVFFALITTGCLALLTPSLGDAKEHESENLGRSSAQVQTASSTEGRSVSKVVAGMQANQLNAVSTGMVYAPRDVVDLTRLVLETSRDQTTHMAHYIEHATTVIVIFFSVLGAVGAAFGVHKLNDIESKAKKQIEKFEQDLELSRETAIKDLRRETYDQVELLLAKLEIEKASGDTDVRAFNSAANRIKPVLERNQVPPKSRLSALADHAYAIKRLGRTSEAYANIVEAIKIAQEESLLSNALQGLLAFNAACYAGLLAKPVECMQWLEVAIQKNPDYKSKAQNEVDLACVKNSPEFSSLTN